MARKPKRLRVKICQKIKVITRLREKQNAALSAAKKLATADYAKTDRFWKGGAKTALAMGYHQPVNKQAARLLNRKGPSN